MASSLNSAAAPSIGSTIGSFIRRLLTLKARPLHKSETAALAKPHSAVATKAHTPSDDEWVGPAFIF